MRSESSAGSRSIRRLFEAPKPVEPDYFRLTAAFPITHVVMIRLVHPRVVDDAPHYG